MLSHTHTRTNTHSRTCKRTLHLPILESAHPRGSLPILKLEERQENSRPLFCTHTLTRQQIDAPRFKGAFPATLFDPLLYEESAKGGIFVRARGDGAPTVSPGFKVVVLAQQRWQDYDKELRPCFGSYWDKLSAIRVIDRPVE